LQWIRGHHLKAFSCISFSFNYPQRIDSTNPNDTIPVFDSSKYSPVADTETWTFSYTDDTLIASNFNRDINSTTIMKFDDRNTLRENGNFLQDPRSSDVFLYDSLGRELSYIQSYNDSVVSATIAKIIDSARWSKIDYEDTKSITYWGPAKRIDSEVCWLHETDNHINDLSLYYRVHNYFDKRNHIIASKTTGFHNQDSVFFIDSTIRDSKGRIMRKSVYGMYGENSSPCLYQEDLFDKHGNVTFELRRPEGSHYYFPCSSFRHLDTVTIQYKYDKRGRPIERIQKGDPTPATTSTTFYAWRDDNLPLSRTIVRSNGSIFVAENYIYEF
ncbi:MAG TPA: hypothetical protein VGM92_11795, partial [Candidatus Kapabacteria bacterium]